MRQLPKYRRADDQFLFPAVGITTDDCDIVFESQLKCTSENRLSVGEGKLSGKGKVQHCYRWNRTHGRDITETYGERLTTYLLKRRGAQLEMDALQQEIGGQDLPVGGRLQDRRIIAYAQYDVAVCAGLRAKPLDKVKFKHAGNVGQEIRHSRRVVQDRRRR